ncbi:hypothetical protein EVAR_81186_1 [Eumeta japonica]|uniref:Uncharacterized protein n=1 Tax=Eumeta variegata TaxID=151549 RepID=A0A4C1UK48_EUMVA|nr:hypothetical protein EVAR_81186_1 [Eumeta japonica]
MRRQIDTIWANRGACAARPRRAAAAIILISANACGVRCKLPAVRSKDTFSSNLKAFRKINSCLQSHLIPFTDTFNHCDTETSLVIPLIDRNYRLLMQIQDDTYMALTRAAAKI